MSKTKSEDSVRRSSAPAPGPVGPQREPRRGTVPGAVERLAAGLAHDLNNILLVLQGYAEMAVEESGNTPGVRSLLAEMKEATSRASRLVRDLQLIGERGAFAPRLVDLSQVVRRCLPSLVAASGPSIEVRPFLEGVSISADEEMLVRLLEALCVRAREAMPEGGTISIRTGPGPGPGFASLRVADTGSAPLDEVRERIFEPYQPGPGGAKGQGLGMTVARAVAARHGGSIEIRPLDQGTEIEVLIPSTEAPLTVGTVRQPARPQKPPETLPAPALHAPAPPTRAVTVLVAEDDDSLRALAVKVLTREGYTVLAARDGEEAVRMFERERSAVRVVLLDDVMPRLGGRAAQARIQTLDPSVPVILCVGYDWKLEERAEEAAGASQTLRKPWRPRDLLRMVQEGLERGR